MSTNEFPNLVIKKGRERPLLRHHPWIFSGSVAHLEGQADLGATVSVRDYQGDFLAWAALAPGANIRGRVWSWQESERIEADFFRRRLANSLEARRPLLEIDNNAVRLVNAESDGLPGLIVDRYGEDLVLQCLSAGPERWRDVIAESLVDLTGLDRVYERSDVDVRELEGLAPRSGPLRGYAPMEQVEIVENGLRYLVDIRRGHKTGFYIDQRENRERLAEISAGRDVLNCFAYTGGFSVAALAGGAQSVVSIETSSEAITLGEKNLALNGLDGRQHEWLTRDVFSELRRLKPSGRRFDLIVLDPPKFAPTRRHAEKAARGYKDINLSAFRLLRPGGYLMTFSCSGGVSAELFQKIVAGAALDAGVEAQIEARLSQGPDHPVALNFPEGEYLKGLLVRIKKGH